MWKLCFFDGLVEFVGDVIILISLVKLVKEKNKTKSEFHILVNNENCIEIKPVTF